ncbi:hypothetical protein I2I11_04045 [Pontibacter sp. 172403-2]|uniref:hypothetical protein n=1 Tax=Pontibacter rufus TaxID=2791028 RepID=UPI0018AFAD8C|nr:hypothetical protein [Pontibacter sp. 172403-2]MBF9252455.1 hypothetical protein [Pontibacter sp. 172403-2]
MRKPLFTTVENLPIYHGDKYWAFTDDSKEGACQCTADEKFDYSDNIERFKFEETIKEAIEVFKWCNNN